MTIVSPASGPITAAGKLALLPTADVFQRGANVLVMKDGQPLYVDATHLSEAGVALVKKRLADAVDKALSSQRESAHE